MKKVLLAAALTSMLAVPAYALNAQTDAPPTLFGSLQVGFLTKDMDVVVLNEGGKYHIAGLKHLAQGATCTVHKDQLIWKHPQQQLAADGQTAVRVGRPAFAKEDCPLGTLFVIPTVDYHAAHEAYASAVTK